MAEKKARMVNSHDVHLDSEYIKWIQDVKLRYRGAQIKASVKVNSEKLLFNWRLGRDLVIRKAEEIWGSGIVEQVSLDLQNEFPSAQGFSTRNLWYMKQWYEFYEHAAEKLHQLGSEIEFMFENQKLHQLGAEIVEPTNSEKHRRENREISFPTAFGFVPWRHHVEIITRCKDVDEACFYIKRTIEEGFSRSDLCNSIEADMYHRIGKADTNFDIRLSLSQSKLAQEITKDTYDLSFVTLPEKYDETMLEAALEKNITRFLLELGTGFAFVGRQAEIIASGKTRRFDMLFYHIRLRCYIVVDLKVKPFQPEFVGKMNFYVNAVNDLLKTPNENPTIGLLICREKDRAEVQWALESIQNPIGVATYGNITVEEAKALLPSVEDIQACIERTEEEFRLRQKNEG